MAQPKGGFFKFTAKNNNNRLQSPLKKHILLVVYANEIKPEVNLLSTSRALLTPQDNTESIGSRSTLISKNVTIRGHRTSIRLEPEMWNALKDIADRENTTIHNICSLISLRKQDDTSLTAAIRVFLMLYYRAATTAEGHARAGHGSFDNMKRRARVTEDTLIRAAAH